MMTKKPQKTDLQQEDHHPRAYGSMMLAAKEEVEKEKGKGKADRECFLCGQKRPFQGALPQQVVRAEDPMELLVEHFAVPEG